MKKGAARIFNIDEAFPEDLREIDILAIQFQQMLEDWHAKDDKADYELEHDYHLMMADEPEYDKPKPYISPSSAGSCERELALALRGAKPDDRERQSHQGRWTRIGTAIGTTIQKDLLYIEKHVPDAPFVFERTSTGYPMFEGFAAGGLQCSVGDKTFHLAGSPDGIIIHRPTGKRIGLEIKSKQTTPARTSPHSMKWAERKHVDQVTAYARIFGLDEYLIVYVNAAKKKWNASEEDLIKSPDLRVFGIDTSEAVKQAQAERLAGVAEAGLLGKPLPKLNLAKWTFNNYKQACVDSLTDEEYAELVADAKAIIDNEAERKARREEYRGILADLRELRKKS